MRPRHHKSTYTYKLYINIFGVLCYRNLHSPSFIGWLRFVPSGWPPRQERFIHSFHLIHSHHCHHTNTAIIQFQSGGVPSISFYSCGFFLDSLQIPRGFSQASATVRVRENGQISLPFRRLFPAWKLQQHQQHQQHQQQQKLQVRKIIGSLSGSLWAFCHISMIIIHRTEPETYAETRSSTRRSVNKRCITSR